MNLPDIHLDADICHIAPRLAVGFLFREAVANHLGSTESFKSRYPVRLGRLTGDAAKWSLEPMPKVNIFVDERGYASILQALDRRD